MQTDFGAALTAWNAFFAAVSGIAATLVGLLFVALALNPKLIVDTKRTGLRIWAAQTFHSFLVVLVIALIALIPDESRTTIVITLLIVGLQGIVRLGLDIRHTLVDPQWSGRRALTLYVSPAAYGICLWLAWAIRRGETDALGWLVGVVLFLLMSAVSSCWDLLGAIGDDLSAE